MKLSSSSFAQRSTPTDSHPGVSESSKYGSQVSTRPSNHASIASLNGLDRDSEVTLLSPDLPFGCPALDEPFRDNRSTNPEERSVQSSTEH